MIFRRAIRTVRTTSRAARHPGPPRPKTLWATATGATLLRPDHAGVDIERAAGLVDEHVLERHFLRFDELDRRAVARDRLDDLRKHDAAVLAQHLEPAPR